MTVHPTSTSGTPVYYGEAAKAYAEGLAAGAAAERKRIIMAAVRFERDRVPSGVASFATYLSDGLDGAP